MTKKISLTQKKIIFIFAIVISAFLLFYFFVYSPAKNKVASLKQELSGVQGQIKAIEAITREAKTMEAGIALLETKYQQLSAKFPLKEEEVIKILSDLAPASNIEIISIRPESKTLFLDAGNQKIEIDGKSCQKVFVSIELRGIYHDLVKYLDSVKESMPAFINIEGVKISKDSAATVKLNINLGVSFYLLS